MASLQDIKGRIASVQSTLKITSAMKMVASAKLHKTQNESVAFTGYSSRLSAMVSTLRAATAGKVESPLMVPHEGRGKAIVVAMASDMSLCGAFNHNAVRLLETTVAGLLGKGSAGAGTGAGKHGKGNNAAGGEGNGNAAAGKGGNDDSTCCFGSVEVIPVGNKMAAAAVKLGYDVKDDLEQDALGDYLIEEYISGRADAVILLYHHFYSVGSQKPVKQQLLPFEFEESHRDGGAAGVSAPAPHASVPELNDDYIFEPSAQELLQQVVPYCVKTKVRAALLDNTLSEHAARMVAMQTATDNAKELLDELRLNYNKQRQQAITAELADIASSTLQ